MKAAIEAFLHLYPDRKKIVVLGDIYELGEHSERLHREVGEFLKEKELQLLTVGKDSHYISEVAGGTHFQFKENVTEYIQEHYLSENYILLFKASRGMKLETIIKELTQ